MQAKTISKTIITLFLILFVFGPIIVFLAYPTYNNLLLLKKEISTYNIAKEKTVSLLAQIAPLKEKFNEEILGVTSIEESLSAHNIVLDQKILEDLDTSLTIEDINIHGSIYQGVSSKTMDKGFWHFPLSQYPGEKGNVVIIGHRFLNIPPARDTFYNLDKIKIGDEIKVKHIEGEYTYIVVEKKIVAPNDMSTIDKSEDYRLTLITCTPLWTSEKRLVVVAKLDKLYKKV